MENFRDIFNLITKTEHRTLTQSNMCWARIFLFPRPLMLSTQASEVKQR
jgi:hypothetical protein